MNFSYKKLVLLSLLVAIFTLTPVLVGADSNIASNTEPTGPTQVAPGEVVNFVFTVEFEEHSFFPGPGTKFTVDQSIAIPTGWSYVGFTAVHSVTGDVAAEFDVSLDPPLPGTPTSVQISETDDVLTAWGTTTVTIQLQAPLVEGAHWIDGATGHLADRNSVIQAPWTGFGCTIVASRSATVTATPTERTIPSDGVTTYSIEVENTGNIADDYDLSISGTGYTSDLVTPQTIPSGGTYTYTLTYTDPSSVAGTDAIGQATATSQTDGSSTDTESVTTHVVNYATSISVAPGTEQTMPNSGTRTYTVTIHNDGDVADTFDWTLVGAGYSVVGGNSGTTASLAAGGTEDVTVTYTPSGLGDFGATFTSTSNGGLGVGDDVDTETLTTHVVDYSVDVTYDKVEDWTYVGGSITYVFTITNDGGEVDSYDWTLSGTGYTTVGGMTGTVGPLAAAGGSDTVTVTFTDATGLGDYVGNLDAVSTSQGASVSDDEDVTSHVVNYDVTTTSATVEQWMPNSGTSTYTVTITNTGDVADTFDWTVSGAGYTVVGGNTGTTASLAPAGTEDITITYTPTGLGTFTGNLEAESNSDSTDVDDIDLTTHVVTYGVSQVAVSPSRTISINDPAETFPVTITNTGDVADTFDITIAGAGYTIVGGPFTTGSIAAGDTDTYDVTYTPSGVEGLYPGTATATSNADPTKDHDLALSVQEWDYQLTAPAGQTGNSLDEVAKVYTMTWTNPGNVAVTVAFSKTGPGTLGAASATIADGGTYDLTITYPGQASTDPDPALSTITGTVQEDTSVAPSTTVDHDVYYYGFTTSFEFTGRRFVEIGGTTTHPFVFTSNTNQGTAAYTVTATWGTAPAPLNQASTAFNLGVGAGDTATAGTYDSTVTVTSVEDPRKTEDLITRTWVTDAANHETETGVGTGAYDHSATVGLTVDLTTPGTHNIDLWKLTANPDNDLPNEVPLYYGGFVVDPTAGITDFHVTVEIPEGTPGLTDIDPSSMDAYLLTPCGTWYSATSGDFNYDAEVDQADFSIIAANWNAYGSDYVVFAVAAEEKFIPIAGPLPPVPGTGPVIPDVPDVEVPDDATPEEAGDIIGDAILDVITDDTTTEAIADIIEAETEGSTTEEVAEVILTVVEESTTEETAEIVADIVADLEIADAVEIVEAVTEASTAEEVAAVVVEVVADRTVEEAAEIVADIVADETVEEAAEVILEVIEERPVEEQAEILVEQLPEQAAAVVEELEVEAAVDIIEEAVVAGTTEEIAEIVNDVEPEVVAEVLLDSDPQLAAEVVNKMAGDDLNSAAIRVEEAVKKKVGTTDAAKSAEYEAQLDSIVTASLTEAEKAQALVDLFIEIANLPNTPSTVAEVFEIIGLDKTMEVVTIWVEKGAFSELAKVYSYLTPETLGNVYTAMTTAARTAVFPYFDAATLGNLPVLTTFTVAVDASPATVETGDTVTVTATITNTGDETGDIRVTMTEGSTEESEIVTLEAGASETMTWTMTKATAGTYTVDVNGETASWTVEAPPTPAAFETSNLAVTPASIMAGEDVTVTVDIENTGEESGSTTVAVEVDGVEVDSELVTLDGEASTTVTFTVTSETEGAHTVEVDGESASFTVEPAPAGFPTTYLIVGIVIVAAAAYFYMQQQKPEE